MNSEPPEHVREQLAAGTISEAQWLLYCAAFDACESSDLITPAKLYVGPHVFGVSAVGLDVSLPGIIIAQTPDEMSIYVDWSQLAAVLSPG